MAGAARSGVSAVGSFIREHSGLQPGKKACKLLDFVGGASDLQPRIERGELKTLLSS